MNRCEQELCRFWEGGPGCFCDNYDLDRCTRKVPDNTGVAEWRTCGLTLDKVGMCPRDDHKEEE